MKSDHRCRWVRRRLPLLAGGDLGVEDRRKAERHLIGCPDCRGHHDASVGSLALLHQLGEGIAPSLEAPSVWPALAQQIRQSRHAIPPLSWWERPFPRPWGFAGLATALSILLVASTVPRTIEEGPATATVVVLDEAPAPTPSPIVGPPAPMAVGLEVPTLAKRLAPRSALPDGSEFGLTRQAAFKPIEPPSSILRFDYDLDHGTPMSPGNHDPQRTF